MTSEENLEKLAQNDWEVAMEPVWKEAKAHYKQQEKEIRDHNKKIEDQEKRECTMDKQVAAAKKKADADAQNWRHYGDMRWQGLQNMWWSTLRRYK